LKPDQTETKSLQGKARFIQPVIVAAIMAFLVTAVVTFVNIGFPPDYLRRWMTAYGVAFPVAAMAAFIAIPIAARVTTCIVDMLNAER